MEYCTKKKQQFAREAAIHVDSTVHAHIQLFNAMQSKERCIELYCHPFYCEVSKSVIVVAYLHALTSAYIAFQYYIHACMHTCTPVVILHSFAYMYL